MTGPGSTSRGRRDRSPLARLLDEGGLHSVFQPIVHLETGSVVGYEALARGPRGPLESPDALFGEARDCDLLEELDVACRAAALRGASELGMAAPLTVFVNMEPEVLDAAPPGGVPARNAMGATAFRLAVELTERALATRPAELLRAVEQLRDHGWRIVLDDVGVESSSLAFMALLRPDVVKLDLRLVQGCSSAVEAEVMHAVNAYAEQSGALVLAEGIETEQHLVKAHALGAALGQGWMLGRPGAAPAPEQDVAGVAFGVDVTGWDHDPPSSPFTCLPPGAVLRRSPKRLLVEVSRQLEREALRIGRTCVVAASFQSARHFDVVTARRYRELAEQTGFVCALGAGLPQEPAPGVRGGHLEEDDPLRGEWALTVLGPHFSAALLARDLGDTGPDPHRRFDYAVTYRRDVVSHAAHSLLWRVAPLSRAARGVPTSC